MNTELEAKNLEYNYQSRFQIVNEPLQCLPHKCGACGRGSSFDTENPLQFVDWNLEVEFFGKLFICTNCLREMCNQMGYADPEQVIDLKNQCKAYHSELIQVWDENKELKNALGSLGVVFDNPVFSNNLSSDSETVDENDETGIGEQNDIVLGDSEGEIGSTEQTTESRSTDVSNNESDDFSDLL